MTIPGVVEPRPFLSFTEFYDETFGIWSTFYSTKLVLMLQPYFDHYLPLQLYSCMRII